MCIRDSGFTILNGIVMLQNIGRRIVGVVHHPVGVHTVEVVLELSLIHIYWGNGSDRKKRITSAGYDYSAVQKRVNELLK